MNELINEGQMKDAIQKLHNIEQQTCRPQN